MLFAQRKRRQRIAGKIGHDDSEYEIDHHHNIGILPQGQPRNTPRAYNGGPPATPRRQPHYVEQQQQQPWQQQQPSALMERFDVNFTPLQVNGNALGNNYRGGLVSNFGQALPPLPPPPVQPAAAWAPLPPVVNKNPLWFKPMLGACAPVSHPLIAPGVNACYHQSPPQYLYNCAPAAPNNLPPLQLPPVNAGTPRAETPLPYINNPIGRSCSRGDFHRPRSAAVGTLPNLNAFEDSAEAKRAARQRAIEFQQENARLCEERRRQQQLERQLQMEEERRREDAARAERLRLGQKEQSEMEREHSEAAGRVKKGRGGGRSNWTSDEQLREDLMRQINDKKQRQEDERRAAELEMQKEKENNKNSVYSNFYSDNGTDHLRGGRGGSPEPLEHTAPGAEPLGNGAAAGNDPVTNMAIPAGQLPGGNPHTLPQSYLPFAPHPLGTPRPFPAFQLDPILPLQRPGVVAGMASAASVPAAGNDYITPHLPPFPSIEISTPRDRAPTREAERVESHLRDMINEHESITRMLESEVPTKPSEIPLYRPQPIAHTKVSFTSPTVDNLRWNPCGAPPAAAGTGTGTASAPAFAMGYAAACGGGSDELSAEPSTFVGAQLAGNNA
ncbi:uncharacterized protein TEOVI_000373200 [Trypanosoma equiperdum]|uniref:Uncharacterized protein n=1 Tax=Trypanosoma equiperdum TaxID=5694 RepID=A0A1G4IIL4_TRYEQ|nr:hypothetical protein, conserved [Trypanosoma equiperdum]